ncbi:MAG TPA: glutamine amidotransferase [Acidobacteria bacterium]|nr:glutamine amidotransferase [Acidobacteriota bacterium]
MQPILIVKTGEPSEAITGRYGSFEHWIADGLGLAPGGIEVVPVFQGAALPEPEAIGAVVVTGSPAMVTDHGPWSERTARWLRRAAGASCPILGICYGHQLLAHALGGTVGDNPAGREIGTITVRRLPASDRDPLLSGLPRQLIVQATHVQSVLDLPPGAVRLAESNLDPHHAFRWGEHVWGVQFHPEFQAEVMRAFLEERADVLRSEGFDVERLIRETRDSGHGHALLRRFADLAHRQPRTGRAIAGRELRRSATAG